MKRNSYFEKILETIPIPIFQLLKFLIHDADYKLCIFTENDLF